MVGTSITIPLMINTIMQVLQPHESRNLHGLDYSTFARHYSQNHYCFLFLRILRCFSSPGFHQLLDMQTSSTWVAPFGHLRIKDCVHLPAAFRSLPRPSSSLRAKASPIRPYLLPSLYLINLDSLSNKALLLFALLIIIFRSNYSINFDIISIDF